MITRLWSCEYPVFLKWVGGGGVSFVNFSWFKLYVHVLCIIITINGLFFDDHMNYMPCLNIQFKTVIYSWNTLYYTGKYPDLVGGGGDKKKKFKKSLLHAPFFNFSKTYKKKKPCNIFI